MITYFLLVIILGIVSLICSPLGGLSNVILPAQIATSISQVSGSLAIAWHFMPITIVALIAAIGVIVVVENWVVVYKVIRWVYRKIPGIS